MNLRRFSLLALVLFAAPAWAGQALSVTSPFKSEGTIKRVENSTPDARGLVAVEIEIRGEAVQTDPATGARVYTQKYFKFPARAMIAQYDLDWYKQWGGVNDGQILGDQNPLDGALKLSKISGLQVARIFKPFAGQGGGAGILLGGYSYARGRTSDGATVSRQGGATLLALCEPSWLTGSALGVSWIRFWLTLHPVPVESVEISYSQSVNYPRGSQKPFELHRWTERKSYQDFLNSTF